jgi:streptogramin lyase
VRRIVFALLLAGAIAAGPAAVALASPGDLLVGGDDGFNGVLRIKPNGNHSTVASGAPLTNPAGLDIARDGTIFVTDYGLPGLIRVNPNSGNATQVGSFAWAGPADVVVGPDKKLYVADGNLDDVFRVNPATGDATPLTSGSLPNATGLTLDARGNLLVAFADGVNSVNRSTGAMDVVSNSPKVQGASGVVRSPSGAIYVNNGSTKIFRVNPSTGEPTLIAHAGFLNTLYDMDILPNGNLLAVADSSPHARVVLVNPKTGQQDIPPGGTLADAAGEGIRVEPPNCGGKVASIVGSTGNDKLRGTKFPDVIAGLGGNDVIKGAGGNDVICGNAGKDTLAGGAGDDKLSGGPGGDSCSGGAGHDRLRSC